MFASQLSYNSAATKLGKSFCPKESQRKNRRHDRIAQKDNSAVVAPVSTLLLHWSLPSRTQSAHNNLSDDSFPPPMVVWSSSLPAYLYCIWLFVYSMINQSYSIDLVMWLIISTVNLFFIFHHLLINLILLALIFGLNSTTASALAHSSLKIAASTVIRGGS